MYQDLLPEIRQTTSAHLAQTMTILGMAAEEIQEKVEGELSKNPFLEINEERICPVCHRRLPENGKCPICSNPKPGELGENIVFISPRDEFYSRTFNSHAEPFQDEPNFDSAQSDDLATYVLKQIAPDLEPEERPIAAHLLTGLDEDGFFTDDLFDLAQYFHIPPSKIEKVLKIIQHADPIGVCSRDLQEALSVQLDHLAETTPIPSGTREVIADSFEELTHGHYKEIAKAHNISIRQVQQIEKFIGENLNPFPARAHWGVTVGGKNVQDVNTFQTPDILIYYLNDDPENPLVIEVVMPIRGILTVNQAIRREIKHAPEDKAEEWKNDFDKANLLVKSVNQRNSTISQLMKIISSRQEAYIRKGEEYLISMTRAEIADVMNVHESTISRAVANKTVMLPNRKVIELSAFFDRSLNVRTVLKELIQNEKTPLTDAKLAELLKERGFDVARRTVAKYRLMEGIASAHQRKTNDRP